MSAPANRALMYTCVAMLAFAGNSIICRLALREDTIDPASFTAIRLISGATLLLLISLFARRNRTLRGNGSWISGLLLFTYALCFSYAYVALDTGVGALILFGFVQATMVAASLWSGDRPGQSEWIGWVIASGGLTWLLFPGAAAPPLSGSLLMAAAGISWGLYSIRGRAAANALATTTVNFLFASALIAALMVVMAANVAASPWGIALAIASGTLTSALGYVIWYAALNYLSTMQAALVQLSVPIIAAGGGIALLAEPLSLRLSISTILVLGGIGFALKRGAQ